MIKSCTQWKKTWANILFLIILEWGISVSIKGKLSKYNYVKFKIDFYKQILINNIFKASETGKKYQHHVRKGPNFLYKRAPTK